MLEESCELDQENSINKEEQIYSKLSVLGEGSMGKAYLVKSNQDQQLYVMKRINIGYLSAEHKEAAKREAQLHSIVSHPNIISFKEIYHTTKDKLCIIMEYAEGGDLDNFVQKREGKIIPEDQVLELFSQICLGVREIHSKKIIHRDLKGANIFLTADKNIKIGDFGISKIADQTIQASKSFVGTPYYLSPEMVEGKKYSTKADVWSLGVILYQLCTLKLPFEAHSLPLLALKILKGSFPPVTGPYSRQLKSLILSLLQVNQTRRPTINQILAKPIISKYTGEAIKPTAIHITSKKMIPQVFQPKKKETTASKEQEKIKQKEKREEAKEKREKLRREMQEELKQKRKENTKNSEPKEEQKVLKKIQRSMPEIDEKISPSQSRKTIEKPWKVKKELSKKGQIEVEMFLPEDRPKRKTSPEKPLSPQNDFKVQIFVSKKPEAPTVQKNTETTTQNLEDNDHEEGEEECQEECEDENEELSEGGGDPEDLDEQNTGEYEQRVGAKNELDELMLQVNGAKMAVQELKGNFQQIKLLEDSQIFENENEASESKRKENNLSKQDEESLRFMNSSENLEQCRQILQDGLGEEKFIEAHKILNQHLIEATEKRLSGQNTEDYTFNREVIREKLWFLGDEEFNRYVVLMYTLIIMEDEEMKQNLDY